MRICVTGSEGLIGTRLVQVLCAKGDEVSRLDTALPPGQAGHGSILVESHLEAALRDCQGVVHLAALSRVVWGERDPDRCWELNVGGTRRLLRAIAAMRHRPWVVLASSREVYGVPGRLPAREEDPCAPINAYGRSKLAVEQLGLEAAWDGIAVAIARFSNVYGSTRDHSDRVVPAFCAAAARGEPLRVNGGGLSFDFTHVEDTVRGIVAFCGALAAGERLPPIHFTTGRQTTLADLAALARRAGGNRSEVLPGPVRSYDVAHFVGATDRAERLLGWRARIPVETGVERLVESFRQAARSVTTD